MSRDAQTLAGLVARALAEDVGDGDVTSQATVPAGTRAVATITQKAAGVVFGLDAAEATFRALDPGVRLERLGPEAQWREPPAPVLHATGDARALLGAERTALNFLQRLSGVATLTARCVRAVEGTGAQILDTRKTTPGLRALEKAAVAAGGGVNHRRGLHDMLLIKEIGAHPASEKSDSRSLHGRASATGRASPCDSSRGRAGASAGRFSHARRARTNEHPLE